MGLPDTPPGATLEEPEFDNSSCPLPPHRSWLHPEVRTALASHPRSGSTWLRFLLERSCFQPCGFEDPGWANILPHVGGMDEPNEINEEGVVVKTHSICYGCWHGAPLWKRLRLRNTTLKTSIGQKLLGVSEADELEKIGNCLIFPPGDLESVIRSRAKSATKLNKGTFICRKTYDRAVVLIRDPLDVFRSNYHYRTKVLKVKATPNWKHANYAFVRERAQAYMNFYQGWLDFAHVRPAMLVYYEHLKLRPAQEVRRILQFLEFQFVNEEKLHCAVEQSALGKLKQESSLHNRIDARSFFGSRNETEAQENLSYTFQLLTHFDKSGLFSLASTMGYVTYRGGVPAAQALASGFVESQIEAVSFPWRLSSTTSERPTWQVI